jgi:lipopolysaccharide cholinephosphotransferase
VTKEYDGESVGGTVLRRLQLTELEILKEVVRICESNALQYFLTGGTLLGAVRHKGFIPWDDDVDIAMPRKDYDRFFALCRDQLDVHYYVHSNDTDPLYWMPYAKIRKRDTVFDEVGIAHLDVPKGIFIDVFPLDSAGSQTGFFRTAQARAVTFLKMLIHYRAGIFSARDIGWMKRLVLAVSSVLSIHALSKLQQRVMSWNTIDDAPYYVSLGSHYASLRTGIPKERYLPATKVEFEGEMLSAPRDCDYVLRRVYGDYMQLPSEDEQHIHTSVRVLFDTQRQERP